MGKNNRIMKLQEKLGSSAPKAQPVGKEGTHATITFDTVEQVAIQALLQAKANAEAAVVKAGKDLGTIVDSIVARRGYSMTKDTQVNVAIDKLSIPAHQLWKAEAQTAVVEPPPPANGNGEEKPAVPAEAPKS